MPDVKQAHSLGVANAIALADDFEGVGDGERLHIHDPCLQAQCVKRVLTAFDILVFARGQQNIDHVGVTRRGSEHFEIQADFIQRIRNVLIGFDLYLAFYVRISKI